MKIAYLVHSYRDYDELIETINQLIKQDDHVFVMINDNDLREKIHFVYAESNKVHISSIQEFAQEGDLSMARGTILQMKEAVRIGFDYYINLSDGMLPIKSKKEIVEYLKQSNTNFYYVDRSEKEDKHLRKKTLKYYPFTNLLSFPTGKVSRTLSKVFASILNLFGLRRSLDDEILIGSPYFIIKHEAATLLSEHFDYVSQTFKLSWYAEEMYIPMMMKKFNINKHANDDCRILGSCGKWVSSHAVTTINEEVIAKHPHALFAAKILADTDPGLYQNYFDIYNR
ncbi:MAG: beta-1,6-N-acetylglucosaminyltransferase [Breznakia sp.]